MTFRLSEARRVLTEEEFEDYQSLIWLRDIDPKARLRGVRRRIENMEQRAERRLKRLARDS